MGIIEKEKYIEVHPTFLYESIITLILFIILIKIGRERKFKGQLTYMYFIVYGLERMLVEGLRTDSLMLGSIRISQILSLILLMLGTGLYLYTIKKEGW